MKHYLYWLYKNYNFLPSRFVIKQKIAVKLLTYKELRHLIIFLE